MALSRLIEHYRRGEFASVVDAADQFGGPPEARAAALRLAGQSAGKLARFELAATYFLRCVELTPAISSSHAECLANAGLMLGRAGHPKMAALAWLCDLRETALRPAHDVSVRQLVHHFATQPEARLACLAIAARSPGHFHAYFPAYLDLLSAASTPSATPTVSPPAVRGLISVVVCSHRDERFAGFEVECARAFAGDDVEILRVSDARYMGDGYRRGMARARGEWLLFVHDDIEFLSPDFGRRVRESFAGADVFFPVGSASLAGPAWFSAGAQHLRGSVTLPGSGKDVCDVAWCGIAQPAEPLTVGDGFLIGARRDVVGRVGWDEDSADAFHGYDLSFTSRAARSGARVRAATRLQVLHHSTGDFDANWFATASRICGRLAIPRGAATSARWVRRDGVPRAEAIALFDRAEDWQAHASSAIEPLVVDLAERCRRETTSSAADDAVRAPMQRLCALALRPTLK